MLVIGNTLGYLIKYRVVFIGAIFIGAMWDYMGSYYIVFHGIS